MRFILQIAILLIPTLVTAKLSWYKGNTHAHTTLCGHADSSPSVVAQWYHDHGYNFTILSEHNRFIDPTTVKLSGEVREDFILVPGEEVTGRKHIHTTAMNVGKLVPWHFDHPERSGIIQQHVNATRAAGGTTILNHPNFHWAVKAEDLIPVKHLHMFELYNGHPAVRNFGDAHHPSTEQQWDAMLTSGMRVYGVASDDAHQFATWGKARSNPGRGWVMVRAENLCANTITEAMLSGEFYSSSGVQLKTVDLNGGTLKLEVDTSATEKELESPILLGSRVKAGQPGYEIEFIGPEGKVLHAEKGTHAEFNVPVNVAYARAKATLRKHRKDGTVAAYFAWTQPVFTDGR